MRPLFDAVAAAHTVVTPNAELAAALSAAVERDHVAAGRQIWPTPQIHDFGSWLRQQYARRQFIDPSLPRCLSDFEEREFWRAVVLDEAGGSRFLEPNGAARAARRARRAMYEYGIPFAALSASVSEETDAFIEWNRAFEERCREHHCISSDQLLSNQPHEAAGLVWIDNVVWRPAARRWLQRVGAPLAAEQGGAGGAGASVRVRSPAAEAAAMAEWAHAALQSDDGFRAWICIPDLNSRRAQVEDAFDAVLAPERFSLRPQSTAAEHALAGGTPLASFAPVRAALDLLSAATTASVSFERFSALLRSPGLHADSGEESDAAVLDLGLRRSGPSEARLGDWLTLAERLSGNATRPPAALLRLRRALRALEEVAGRQPLSRWVTAWIAALEAASWSQRQVWSSTEFQAAERFRELLAALAMADSLFGARSSGSAHSLLRRAADETAFQPQTGVPAIWVSGQLMDPWLSYDGVWIAGCSEEQWPPPVDPVPLLPVRLQREYGVVAAGVDTQLAFAEELQRRWSARAASQVFSCADTSDGRATRPSPLTRADEPWVPAADAVTHPHWHRLLATAPSMETLLDERAPPFAAGEKTRGVGTLRAQSLCAFRGFAETRLIVEELESPTPGFNARERGELLHHALEHVWASLRDSRTLQSTAAPALRALIDDSAMFAIALQCRRRDPGARWRRRELPRLSGLLYKWLQTELGRAPFTVERLEEPAQHLNFDGLELRVRIDRLDVLDDGSRVLIDYKTGTPKMDWRGERPDNPQLPVYALLRPDRLVAVAYGKVNAGECRFYPESERPLVFAPQQRRSALEDMPDFAALITLWSQRLHRIAGEFSTGAAEVAPTPNACRSCRLQSLCRIPSALDEDADDGEDIDEQP